MAIHDYNNQIHFEKGDKMENQQYATEIPIFIISLCGTISAHSMDEAYEQIKESKILLDSVKIERYGKLGIKLPLKTS